jgi:hypothetical protein
MTPMNRQHIINDFKLFTEPQPFEETRIMTTPKAEAMANQIQAEWYGRLIVSKSSSFIESADFTLLCEIIAEAIEPLLSAEKERDELKANRQYETDLVATLTSERDELKAILELLPFDILDKEESGNLDAADFVDNSNATINVLRLARAFLAKQGEK